MLSATCADDNVDFMCKQSGMVFSKNYRLTSNTRRAPRNEIYWDFHHFQQYRLLYTIACVP